MMNEYPKVEKDLFNVNNENLQKLASLFPSAVKDGQLDIDALKEELGQFEEVGQEKYELNWAGKQNAKKEARKNVLGKTLRYIEGDGVNEDTTQNLYIEGDNLEVLKLLRKNYYGSIKMIYIDPPYNTGNDFVYNDNFSISQGELEQMQGERDEYGERLQKNSKDSAKYHTNWLNMMYPRLHLAKDLLTDDGIIFIHIDDNEVDNLGKICNDIFQEDNFINIITIKTKIGGVSGSSEGKSLKDTTEFIWVYAKNKNNLQLNPVYIKEKLSDRIKTYEMSGKSWKYTSIMTKLAGKTLIKEDTVHNMKFYGYKELETTSISTMAKELGITEEEVYNRYADKIFRTTNAQSSIRQTVIKETKNFDFPMYGCEYTPIKGKNAEQTIEILYKSGATSEQRNMMMFLSDVVENIDGVYYYLDKISSLWDDIDYNNLTKEGNIEFPNGKKPIKMLQRILKLALNENDIILDFFSGSGSTAHACMQLNTEDNGNRKYIMVQLPERADGEYETICEIGKERIRRAGQKIKEEIEQGNTQLKLGEEPKQLPDIGFKVFRVGETTLNWEKLRLQGKDIAHDYLPTATEKDRLDFTPDYQNDLNVVYEIMLRQEGLPLTSNIEKLTDIGSRTYLVADSYLISLEETITPEMIEKLSALNPLPFKFVFRDSAFDDDIVFKDETFRKLNALIDKNTNSEKKAYTVEFI